MRVLVTGGRGFIGAFVEKELQKKGYEALIYDRSDGFDIREEEAVRRAVQVCDSVIHLAGILGTEELFESPQQAIDINVKGALNLILACTQLDRQYTAIQMPFTGWTNIYQSTKLCAYNLANAYRIHKGLRCSFVRAYNAFGEFQHVHGVQKIIPTFATKAWRGEPLPIWGTGEQLCDLIYAGDIAKMLVDALSFGGGQTFDAGTGYPRTVNQIAFGVQTVVAALDGPKSVIEHLPMRSGETQDGIPPIAKGEGWDLLGWKPQFKYSDYISTIEWYKEDRP